ncbi:MAG: DUF1674 domain-containing protein [Rickettsiaceae bacterium]
MKENNKPDNTRTKEKSSSKNQKEEFGGPKGLEPTRYGDWEKNGRVSDF